MHPRGPDGQFIKKTKLNSDTSQVTNNNKESKNQDSQEKHPKDPITGSFIKKTPLNSDTSSKSKEETKINKEPKNQDFEDNHPRDDKGRFIAKASVNSSSLKPKEEEKHIPIIKDIFDNKMKQSTPTLTYSSINSNPYKATSVRNSGGGTRV